MKFRLRALLNNMHYYTVFTGIITKFQNRCVQIRVKGVQTGSNLFNKNKLSWSS